MKLRVLPLEAQLIRCALTSSVGPAIFWHMVRILLAILPLSLSGGICQVQASPGAVAIRVRALDFKTGRPLKRHRIAIWLSDSAGEIQEHVSQAIVRHLAPPSTSRDDFTITQTSLVVLVRGGGVSLEEANVELPGRTANPTDAEV